MCLLLFIFLKLIFSQKRKARFYLAQNIRFFIQKKRCFLKIAVPEFYNIKKRLSILAKSLKNKNEHELFHMHFQEFCLLFRNTYLREYLWVTVSVYFKGGFTREYIPSPQLHVQIETLEQRCEICSKLTITPPKRRQWCRFGGFIVNFEHISHLCSSFSIVNFEQVNAGWVFPRKIQLPGVCNCENTTIQTVSREVLISWREYLFVLVITFWEGNLSQKSPKPNMWLLLITPNKQTFCIKTNIF